MAGGFRRFALDLPLAVEVPHFGAPSFRVQTKIFAQLSADESTGLVKLSSVMQVFMTDHHPDACSIEPNWGRFGWTHLAVGALPEELLKELLTKSWLLVAPRKLHPLLGEAGVPPVTRAAGAIGRPNPG